MDARRLAIALVLLVGLTLAGCTIASQESEYPEEDEVRDKLTSLETLEANVVTETRQGNNSTTVRSHVVQDLASGQFRSTVETGPNAGVTVVMDGESLWYYEPHRNVVQTIHDVPDANNVSRTVDTVSSIYERLNDDGDGDGSVGISASPTVPSASGGGAGTGNVRLPMGDNVSVTSAGSDTVDGRDVHVVKLRPEDERTLLENATYYIDEEWHVPLRTRVAITVGGRTTVTTQTYTNVSFDEPIEEGTFEFDPPSTATIVEGANGSFEQHSTRSDLVESVDASVPDPSLPDRFQFELAEVSATGTGQSITMIYADSTDTVTITKRTDREANVTDDGERIDVDGQPGRRLSVGTSEAVAWTCQGNTYSVVGPSDGPELLPIAESMACS